MDTALIPTLITIAVPAVLWTAYLYYKDRFKPEPLLYIAISYALGIGSAWLCLQAFTWIDTLGLHKDPNWLILHDKPGFFTYAVGIIGPLEELVKLVPFLLICVHFRAFDEKIDGIIYASMLGLGFASYETYVFSQGVLEGPELYGQAISAPLVHMMFASIWGFGYARARFKGGSKFILTGVCFLIAAIAHGLYDYFKIEPTLMLASSGLILLAWIWRLWTFHRLQPKKAK
jgi:RsiW-degrading membrane proteinase PrsW (M82 family)